MGDLYAILSQTGEFIRAESTAARANRARINGLRVIPLAVQVEKDGFTGNAAEGQLIVKPGSREWIPAGKGQPAKKVDKADAEA